MPNFPKEGALIIPTKHMRRALAARCDEGIDTSASQPALSVSNKTTSVF
jgi:hypothetical protein